MVNSTWIAGLPWKSNLKNLYASSLSQIFIFLYSICTLKVKMSYKQVKTMSETLPHWSFQLDVFSNIKFKMSESWLSD